MKRWLVLASAIVLVSVTSSTGVVHSQQLAIVEGQLKDHTGIVLAFQPLVIEGMTAPPSWHIWASRESLKVIAITDERGFFQVIDLPPGWYTIKALKVGKAPVAIHSFSLPSGYKEKSPLNLTNKLTLSGKLSLEIRPDPIPLPAP